VTTQALREFLDLTLRDLGRTETACWLLLWRDTRPDGTARSTQKSLGERAGVSTLTAYRAIKRLRRLGLLSVVHQGIHGSGPSVYRCHPVPDWRASA
jgi:hypothetical protein